MTRSAYVQSRGFILYLRCDRCGARTDITTPLAVTTLLGFLTTWLTEHDHQETQDEQES